jgi:hypothetical protein
MKIEYGYCQCGCGLKTGTADKTGHHPGWIKGKPIRFINGHNGRGKTQTEEFKKHLSDIRKSEQNPMWVGDKIKYGGLHNWIRRRKAKPKLCERCENNPPYDLANISGNYKRDTNDFIWLCRCCHMETDGRLQRMIHFGKHPELRAKTAK